MTRFMVRHEIRPGILKGNGHPKEEGDYFFFFFFFSIFLWPKHHPLSLDLHLDFRKHDVCKKKVEIIKILKHLKGKKIIKREFLITIGGKIK